MIPSVKILDRSRPRDTCTSEMIDPETRKHGHFHCHAMATYTIDGKPMCKRHAGSFLVDLFANPPATLSAD